MPPTEKKPKKTKAERLAEKQAIEAEKQRLAELERKRIEEENERLLQEAIAQQIRRNELRKIELDYLSKEQEIFHIEQIEKRNASYEKEEKEEIETKQWECFKEAKEESIAENEKEMNAFLTSLREQEGDKMKLPEVFQLVKQIFNISTDVYIALTEYISRPILTASKSADDIEIKEDDRKIKNVMKIELFHSYLSQLYQHISMKLDRALFSLLRYAERYINDKNEIILQHVDADVTIGLYTCYNKYHVHHKRVNFEQLGIMLEIPKEVLGKQKPEPEQVQQPHNENESSVLDENVVISSSSNKNGGHNNNRSSQALVFRVIQMKIDKYSQYTNKTTTSSVTNNFVRPSTNSEHGNSTIYPSSDVAATGAANVVSEENKTTNADDYEPSSTPRKNSSNSNKNIKSTGADNDNDNKSDDNADSNDKANDEDSASYYAIDDYYHIDIFDSPPLAMTVTHSTSSTAASGSGANGSKWIIRDLSIAKTGNNNNSSGNGNNKNNHTTNNNNNNDNNITKNNTTTNNKFSYPYPDKPIRVTITLPKTLIILPSPTPTSEVTVGIWNEVTQTWCKGNHKNGLRNVEYDSTEHSMSFDVATTGVFALIRSKYSDFPYHSWQLSPVKINSDNDDIDRNVATTTATETATANTAKTNDNNNNTINSTINNNTPVITSKHKNKGKILRFIVETKYYKLELEFHNNQCKLISVETKTIATTTDNNNNNDNSSTDAISYKSSSMTVNNNTTNTNTISTALSDLLHVSMRPGLLLHVLQRRGINLMAPIENQDILTHCDITAKDYTLEQNALLSLSHCAVGCTITSCHDWNKQLPFSQIGLIFSTASTSATDDKTDVEKKSSNTVIESNTSTTTTAAVVVAVTEENNNEELYVLVELDRFSSSYMGAPTVGLTTSTTTSTMKTTDDSGTSSINNDEGESGNDSGSGEDSSSAEASNNSVNNNSEGIKYTLVIGDESKIKVITTKLIKTEENGNNKPATAAAVPVIEDDDIKKKSGKTKPSTAAMTSTKKPTTANASTKESKSVITAVPVSPVAATTTDVTNTLISPTEAISLNDNTTIATATTTAADAQSSSSAVTDKSNVIIIPKIYSITPLENQVPHIDASLALLSKNNNNNNKGEVESGNPESTTTATTNDNDTTVSSTTTTIPSILNNTAAVEAIQNVHHERVSRTVYECLRLMRPISLCQIPTPKPVPVIVTEVTAEVPDVSNTENDDGEDYGNSNNNEMNINNNENDGDRVSAEMEAEHINQQQTEMIDGTSNTADS